MGVVTYTAVDRGELVSGHVAGTQYQLETAFQGFPRRLVAKGQKDETLDGTPEGWLFALQHEYDLVTDFIALASRDQWREFFSSVMNAETFQLDLTGTIGSPGASISVWLPDDQINEQQIGGVGVQYSFKVKTLP